MPIIKSAKKRVRTAEKAAIRNSKVKRALKTAVKVFRTSVIAGGKNTAEHQAKAQSTIDTAAKKGLIHKNKAARQKAQLARASKANAAETPTKKSTPKKAAVARKPAVATKTKTSMKKPTAKN